MDSQNVLKDKIIIQDGTLAIYKIDVKDESETPLPTENTETKPKIKWDLT